MKHDKKTKTWLCQLLYPMWKTEKKRKEKKGKEIKRTRFARILPYLTLFPNLVSKIGPPRRGRGHVTLWNHMPMHPNIDIFQFPLHLCRKHVEITYSVVKVIWKILLCNLKLIKPKKIKNMKTEKYIRNKTIKYIKMKNNNNRIL